MHTISEGLKNLIHALDSPTTNAWLLLSNLDDRSHAGNEGYEDEIGHKYLWDNTVPNFQNIRTNDVVLIWDKKRLLGAAIIRIEEPTPGTKYRLRCPFCGSTKGKIRTTISPTYKCGLRSCRQEYESPEREVIEVQNFTAIYEESWVPLANFLDGKGCRSLASSAKSQHSIRPANKSNVISFLRGL